MTSTSAAQAEPAQPEVAYEVGDRVATITLDRPDKLNAITPSMLAAYIDAVRAADADPGVRCIVVTGRGRAFCAGADLSVLSMGADDVAGLARPDALPTVALEVDTPVVMAVNGPCVGLGFALVVAGDIRLASESAAMSAVFPRLGLTAEYGLSWLLPRMIGAGPATEILLTGRAVDAAEALRLGLVSSVHADDELLAAAQAKARDIADACSPWSMRTIKGQLRHDAAADWSTSVNRTIGLMHDSFARPELHEALRARTEKRLPAYGD